MNTPTPDMCERLQSMLDHFEIRAVIEAYAHAADRCDAEAMAEVYHPDSWDNHGPIRCTGPEFSIRSNELVRQQWKTVHHHLGQSQIHIEGDRAGAETYFIASLCRDGESGRMLDQMGGRYIDEFERRDGTWRIKLRTCVSEWAASAPIVEDFLDRGNFDRGSQSRDDPSYRVLNIPGGSVGHG